MKKLIVINLIGGPGLGKSTLAAGLFYELKKLGINCELVTEFAKDKVYEESYRTLENQIYVFGKQFHKMWRLVGKVDIIITDSPLIHSIYYNKEKTSYLDKLIIEQHNRFNNRTYLLQRKLDEKYHTEGRMQTLEQAVAIDKELKNLLDSYTVEYTEIERDKALEYILSEIKSIINK